MNFSKSWNTHLGGFPLTIPWGETLVLAVTMGAVSWISFDQATLFADLLPITWKLLVGGSGAAILTASFLAHEWSHAWMARRQGLGTGEIKVTWWGGSFSNPGIFREPSDFLWVSLAGPATHLLFAGGLWGITLFMEPGMETAFLKSQFILQAVLGIGNLFPLFPMDGGLIWAGLLAKKFGHMSPGLKWSHWSGPALVFLGGSIWLFSAPSFLAVLKVPPEQLLTNSLFWGWAVIILAVSSGILFSWLQGRKLWEFHRRLQRWNNHKVGDMANFGLPTLKAQQPAKTITPDQLPAWIERDGQRVGLVSPYDLPGTREGVLAEYMWPLNEIPALEHQLESGKAYLQLIQQAGEDEGVCPGWVEDPEKGTGVFDPAVVLS